MFVFRLLRLNDADMVITFRPMSHLVQHPNKVVWFIHHIRPFYDLWDSNFRGFPRDNRHQSLRDLIIQIDNDGLQNARKVYTNSKQVQMRLQKYNNIDSEVLYPPLFDSQKYFSHEHNDEIVCIGRLEPHKRPDLFINALAKTKSAVKLRFLGVASNADYANELLNLIDKKKLNNRVILENRWVSEEEKIKTLANCLATIYAPNDEDSYGYPSLESSYSKKPIITTSDSGGVVELVLHGFNGWVCNPTDKDLGDAFDDAYNNKDVTKAMGANAWTRLEQLDISWTNVLRKLLS
jgi:glycosyltransferase involved in cell wall biosynthesis